MASSANGDPHLSLGGPLTRPGPTPGAGTAAVLGHRHSGRRFVIVLTLVLASIALALFVAFRQWKARHIELAAYGADRVAPAIEPLARRVPPSCPPETWRRVVEQMRQVLLGLTGSGLLNLKDMQELRRDLQLRVDAATTESAASTLAQLWDGIERRAGPTLVRHPVLGLASAVKPLAAQTPATVNGDVWTLAVLQTRAMLVALARDLSKEERRQLREAIEARVTASRPESARETLLGIWTMVATERPIPPGFHRPALQPAAALAPR